MWPDREEVRKKLPFSFSSFKNCVCIINCTEIFIERPQSQLARAQVYSNYKIHNTVKYLTGIIPAGAVSFLPYGWGGRKFRFFRNGFTWWLRFSRSWFFNWGRASSTWSSFKNPSFHTRKKQMTASDVDISRQLPMLSVLLGYSRNLKYWDQSFLYV